LTIVIPDLDFDASGDLFDVLDQAALDDYDNFFHLHLLFEIKLKTYNSLSSAASYAFGSIRIGISPAAARCEFARFAQLRQIGSLDPAESGRPPFILTLGTRFG